MALIQALTNQRFAGMAASLVKRLGAQPPVRGSARPIRSEPRRARHGAVERAVLSAVEMLDEPFSVADVGAEITQQAAGEVSRNSIKASLSKLAKAEMPLIRRRRWDTYVRIESGWIK